MKYQQFKGQWYDLTTSKRSTLHSRKVIAPCITNAHNYWCHQGMHKRAHSETSGAPFKDQGSFPFSQNFWLKFWKLFVSDGMAFSIQAKSLVFSSRLAVSSQGVEESYLTVMLPNFIAQMDLKTMNVTEQSVMLSFYVSYIGLRQATI